MSFAVTLIQSPGPLPIKTTFKAPADGPVYFMLSGSAWTMQANSPIGVSLQVDGTTIGSARLYANQASVHQALVPIVVPTNLNFGDHTLTLVVATGSTVTDQNDTFQVTLVY